MYLEYTLYLYQKTVIECSFEQIKHIALKTHINYDDIKTMPLKHCVNSVFADHLLFHTCTWCERWLTRCNLTAPLRLSKDP